MSVVAPGDGIAITFPFGRPRIKVGRGDGREQIGVLESQLPPGGGFGVPHVHDDLDEAFYVLDGEIEYLLGDTWTPAHARTTVFVPAGTVHAFRNASDMPATQLVIATVEAIELVRALSETPPPGWPETLARYRSRIVDAA